MIKTLLLLTSIYANDTLPQFKLGIMLKKDINYVDLHLPKENTLVLSDYKLTTFNDKKIPAIIFDKDKIKCLFKTNK